MSNGGYKGASPARETSPEQYPGVWELTEQFQAQADGNWPFQDDDCAPNSLRLRYETSSNPELIRTPLKASNTQTFTISFWAKRSILGTTQMIVQTDDDYNNLFRVYWDGNDNFVFHQYNGSYVMSMITSARFRDPSAWYHFVIVVDTPNPIQTKRCRLYVNGVENTDWTTSTYGNQNITTGWNAKISQRIGREWTNTYGNYYNYDGCVAEFNSIDGQALSCNEFGFFDGQGIWRPKKFKGDYASGPVYSNNSTGGSFYTAAMSWADAFDGSLSTGPFLYTSDSNTLTLPAGVTWSNSIRVYALRYDGVFKINGTDCTSGITTSAAWHNLTATLGSSGTLSTIEIGAVNTNYFKLFAVELDGVILRNPDYGMNSFYLDFAAGAKDQSGLGNDFTATNIDLGAPRIETTGDITLSSKNRNFFFKGAVGQSIGVSAGNHVWDSSNGVSWSYRGQSGTSVTLTSPYVEISGTTNIDFTNTNNDSVVYWDADLGHGLPNGAGSGSAETFNVEVNGSAGDDKFVDSPVNGNEPSGYFGGQRRGNYATLNPIAFNDPNIISGGLYLNHSSSAWLSGFSTIKTPETGKWFYECTPKSGNAGIVGIFKELPDSNTYIGDQKESYGWYGAPGVTAEGPSNTQVSYNGGATFTNNDVIGVALDLDAGTLTFYKNGTSQGVAFSGLSGSFFFAVSRYNGDMSVNFGQKPFEHPVSGFSPLTTSFLPEPSIKRGDDGFTPFLYQGNGAVKTVDGMRFSPDLVMLRNRDTGYGLPIFDTQVGTGSGNAMRGDQPGHAGNSSVAPFANLTSFNDDGFTLGTTSNINAINVNGQDHVAFSWNAGDGPATTTSVGSLDSSSYNTSDRWSDDVSGSTYGGAGMPVSRMFNGNLTQNVIANSGTSLTFSPSGFGSISSLRLYGNSYTGNSNGITVNGTDFTSLFPTGAGAAADWVTIPVTNLTSIVWSTESNGLENGNLYGIEVDGKLLVDDNQTPPTIPAVAVSTKASDEFGFAISTWTGNGVNGARIYHGMPGADKGMIIVKNYSDTAQTPWWAVYHTGLGVNKNLGLNSDFAQFDETTLTLGIFEYVNRLSFVATQGSAGHKTANQSGGQHVCYAWAPRDNYSAFGSYKGTGFDDDRAPFIHTGFKPRMIWIKSISLAHNWVVFDSERGVQNPVGQVTFLNEPLADSAVHAADTNTGNLDFDILSNGFKLRTANHSVNKGSSDTYIYCAWAEQPFASNARAR